MPFDAGEHKGQRKIRCMPASTEAFHVAAEQHAIALPEDDDEVQLASPREDIEAFRSGTATAPNVKSEGGLFDFEALEAESAFPIAVDKEPCSPRDEAELQKFQRVFGRRAHATRRSRRHGERVLTSPP